MTTDGEHWLFVEARRDDGTPTMFRIRELDPQKQLTKIFVVELPYPKTDSLSRLPNAADYRRLAEFDEQWLRPACSSLGWELVGSKTEDGSFFLYMYGASDPNAMIEKLSPFDVGLGFYDDDDPEWQEYGAMRELLDQAKAIPPLEQQLGAVPMVPPAPAGTRTATPMPNPEAASAAAKTTPKRTASAAAKTTPKRTASAAAKTTPKRTASAAAKTKAKRTARLAAKTKARPARAKPTSRAKAKAKAKRR